MSALWRWLPERWHQRWMDLSGRERLGLGLALLVLALALLWSLGVAPAWRQWQHGQGQTQALQTQWQGMQALQAQASALSAQSRVRPEEAVRLLQTSLSTLGPGAVMTVNGDLATVQIKAASAAAVSQWLAQARVQAQALPVQARLGRSERHRRPWQRLGWRHHRWQLDHRSPGWRSGCLVGPGNAQRRRTRPGYGPQHRAGVVGGTDCFATARPRQALKHCPTWPIRTPSNAPGPGPQSVACWAPWSPLCCWHPPFGWPKR